MVVIPTDTDVRLHYGRPGSELVGWAVTGAGVVALGLLGVSWHRRRHDASTTAPSTIATSDDTEPSADDVLRAFVVNVKKRRH